MIRRYVAVLRLALMTADLLSAVALFVLLLAIRFQILEPGAQWNLEITPGPVAVAYGILWVACLWLLGLYRLRSHLSFRGEAVSVLRASALAGLALLSLLFVLRLDDFSRVFLLLLFVAQPGLTLVSRLGLRLILRWLRRRGRITRYVLIVGAGAEARAFANEVAAHRDLGLAVVGYLAGPSDETAAGRRPVLGTIDDITEVIHANVVDEIAVCLAPQDWQYVEPITRICEEAGLIVRVSMRALSGVLTGGQYEELGSTPIVTFIYGPDRLIGMAAKRLFDIVVSVLAVVVLSPLLIGVAIYIRLADGAPVLFRQSRVGLHGRLFTCLKFRTMAPNAEHRQEEFAHLSTVRGPAFKIPNDPRITKIGGFLRRSSLDELPQLLNVLRGDMSIVGPRPAPPNEVRHYSVWHRRRLMMRPGMTGYWQVEARSEDDFDVRAELDLHYIDRWSLWMDIKILARTVPAVLAQRGR